MIVERSELTQNERDANLLDCCILCSRLYLWPETVIRIVNYWMDNYSDYLLADREEDQFNTLIGGLLENRPRIEITGSESLANRHSTIIKYQNILQFIGSPYHRIPLEYFFSRHELTLFETLPHLILPEAGCFRQKSTGGLDGELHMASFIYDSVAEYFYEPSLMIIYAYLIHMILLRTSIGARAKEDWLPRHYYSLRALNEISLERVACFGDSKRVEVLKEELRVLRSELMTDDLEKAIVKCCHLFREKATECSELMFIKRDALFS